MLVETSALVAIILKEADFGDLLDQVDRSHRPVTTVVNAVEAALSVGKVIGNYDSATVIVRQALDSLGVQMIGVDPDLYPIAMSAYARYGKGTGHPAGLNFGDCFSYAMAKRAAVPLLYKGDDFAQTDLAGG